MKNQLKAWTHPTTGEVRIYINGSHRDHNKLFIVEDPKDDCFLKHSINLDGTAKYIRGNIYKKRDQDIAAINEVLNAFGFDNATTFNEIFDAATGKTQLVEVIV